MHRSWIKPALFVVCLVPFGQLLYRAYTEDLGANPIDTITRFTGSWALFILLTSLAITPLRRITGWNDLVKYRRMFGLFAFFYAALHFSTYLVLDHFFDWPRIAKDILKRPYVTAGFTALVIMIPLAITSTSAMIRRLGKRWQQLHRLVYVAAIAGVVHFYWLVKSDIRRPAQYGIVLALLLGYRLLVKWSPLFAARMTVKSLTSANLRSTAKIIGWLFVTALYSCAGAQAIQQIRAGRLALVTGNPAVAVKHFEQAAALDGKSNFPPLGQSAWTYAGRAYYESMEYSSARQALNRALAQDQNDDVARLYLGLIGARAQTDESNRKLIQSGLQGVFERTEYVKYYTLMGEFWDPTGRLRADLQSALKTFSATQIDWPSAIVQAERLAIGLENEIDAAQRDESIQRRSSNM